MQFEKQQYQIDCVENIISVLEKADYYSDTSASNLEKALKEHIEEKNIPISKTSSKKRLDVLMETGTGKTFTYINAIFEINRSFGQNKFIIVVPRSAIRLGVVQNLKLTKEYFYQKYAKYLKVINYEGSISDIENNFLDKNNLSVLVLTYSSFNKKKNLLNKKSEQGNLHKHGSLWQNIAREKPTVIIDEPHLLTGEKTEKSFKELKESLFIRFGATFPKDTENDLSNVVYTLDSISAFNQYLVKKIYVNTIFSESEQSSYNISKVEPKLGKFIISYFENGDNKQATIRIKEDIGAKTGISQFQGFKAIKISLKEKKIFLNNNQVLNINKEFNLSSEEQRYMIQQTIQKHFEKEEYLFRKNIKTLSLFFIQNIADFRGENPIIKKIFEEEYRKEREKIYQTTKNKEYKEYLDKDWKDGILQVHEGYFSGDKGTVETKESQAVDLILSKKQELLSLNTSLRFVFSVWALQEGWDNPNIFNICKLSSTQKETSRRQQVGRGLRLAVNQNFKRMTYSYLSENEQDFYSINQLDMIVSHHELDFINQIQQEILDDSFKISDLSFRQEDIIDKGVSIRNTGRIMNILEDEKIIIYDDNSETYKIQYPIYDFLKKNRSKFEFMNDEKYSHALSIFISGKSNVENANKVEEKVKIRKEKLKEFKELWKTINQKSKLVYKNIKEDFIIEEVAKEFNKENIPPIEIKVTEQEYNSQNNEIIFKNQKSIGINEQYFKKKGIQNFIKTFTKDDKFPLSFMIKVFNKLNKDNIYNNPKQAKKILKHIIFNKIHNSIIQNVEYQLLGNTEITALQKEDGQYLEEIDYTLIGSKISEKRAVNQLLYDKVIYDSKIEENLQANTSEKINDFSIKVFAKLPKISIPTPFKSYNPDFAFLIEKENKKKLFLVVESKGYDSENLISEEEKRKINYAKKFFQNLQEYIPKIQIVFKTYINTTSLSQILQEIEEGK